MMKVFYLVQLISLFSSLAFGRIVIISDIDDTIKVSHVLKLTEIAANAPRTHNVFRGMPDLYRQIRLKNPESTFYYISQAPRFLMQKKHEKFLNDNGFPEGHLVLRENLAEKQHKIKAIREILKDTSIEYVILVGDNGEKDPKIYAQVVSEFPEMHFITFIRQAYSTQGSESGQPLESGQIGFATPIEVAVVLKNVGRLDELQVMNLETALVPNALARAEYEDLHGVKGPLTFPRWMDTRDLKIHKDVLARNSTYCRLLVNRINERNSRRE